MDNPWREQTIGQARSQSPLQIDKKFFFWNLDKKENCNKRSKIARISLYHIVTPTLAPTNSRPTLFTLIKYSWFYDKMDTREISWYPNCSPHLQRNTTQGSCSTPVHRRSPDTKCCSLSQLRTASMWKMRERNKDEFINQIKRTWERMSIRLCD